MNGWNKIITGIGNGNGCVKMEKRNETPKNLQRCHKESMALHAEFKRMHRHAKTSPPIILLLSLIFWYVVFRYPDIRAVTVVFALLFSTGGLLEAFFLRRLEGRILTPIEKLRKGLEEIARGNYSVKVESCAGNHISTLIDSFNAMASKLKEGEKLQEEYEENRKMLIANISHDLKTPITSIRGYIEAIDEAGPELPENISRYLKVINNNTEYMNRLIDDLFLFSKLDMQKLEFQFVNVDVSSFFNDIMEEFKLGYEEENISFEYDDRLEEACSFSIDRKRIHQVLMNIMSNAIKYGGGKKMSIRTELYKRDGFVHIGIRDDGPGIPGEKLEHIFDRFYRIDNERTKDLASTGLGLAIAKELAEAHGGNISAESKVGEGSCFTVSLPVVQCGQGNEVQ